METIISLVSSGIGSVFPFITLLGILIFVHELGHFLVAKWCGVRVEVFSLGFGKKILKFKRGFTTYAISIIPLGGYVKMFGEQNGDVVEEKDRSASFTHKSVWQRIAIVSAGPLMNFFFAVFLFFVVSLLGEPAKKPIIGDIFAGTSSYVAGFRSGDTLLKISNEDVLSWEDVQKKLNESQGKKIEFLVSRENSDQVDKVMAEVLSVPSKNLLSLSSYSGEIEGLNSVSAGTTVGVKENSPLKILGLKTGYTLTAINNHPVNTWRKLQAEIESSRSNVPLQIDFVTNEGADAQVKQTLTYMPSKMKSYTLENLGLESSDLYISSVAKGSPAEKAGLRAGDRIAKINNIYIKKWDQVLTNIKSFDGVNPVSIDVQRDSQSIQLKIAPEMTTQMTMQGAEEKRYMIGIQSIANIASPEIIIVKEQNPLKAIKKGFYRSVDISVMTVMSFIRLIQTKISHKSIGGILSIGQAASETYKVGIVQFIQMMALISINLFVLNLLPVPVLDGGHLLFYTIELLKGSPLSMSKLEMAQQIGLAILMGLMVLSLFNDVTRVFGL